MKTTFVIILIAQTLLILVLLTFALLQKAEADRQREHAEEQRNIAVEHARRAEEARSNAEKIQLELDSSKESEDRR